MKFKALFIVNPVSGGKSKAAVPEQILRYLDQSLFDADFKFTESVGHAAQLAQLAQTQNYDVVVAVGGDGTINEVASQLVHTKVRMGIIPLGSGNGLARELQVPLQLKEAVANLNDLHSSTIDVISVGERYFFNMGGMGYDAIVSEAFKNSKRRGFWGYLKRSVQEFRRFKPETYQLELDGKSFTAQAFLLSFANSSQYGNNVYISPYSKLNDGCMEVVLVKPINGFELLKLGWHMITKSTPKFDKWESYTAQHIRVKRAQSGPMHLDGEPLHMPAEVELKILPAALQIIVGPNFNKHGEREEKSI